MDKRRLKSIPGTEESTLVLLHAQPRHDVAVQVQTDAVEFGAVLTQQEQKIIVYTS